MELVLASRQTSLGLIVLCNLVAAPLQNFQFQPILCLTGCHYLKRGKGGT